MDLAKYKDIFTAFVNFLLKLLTNVGVIGDKEEDAMADYKPVVENLINAVVDAAKKD